MKMEYLVLLLIVAGCGMLFWYLSRKAEEKLDQMDLEGLIKAAEHGDVFSQFALGNRYREGTGLPRSMKDAVKWYSCAAQNGYVEAQYTLATILDKGEDVPQNVEEARKWYDKAAFQGHQGAQKILASEGWTNNVRKLKAEQPKPAAQQNVHAAPAELEKMFSQAESGDIDAQYNLGIMFYNGEKVGKDHNKAITWFLKAAQQDDPDAQFNLGLMYGRGEGVPKDQKVSMNWFQKAAELGHKEAQEIISRIGKKD